MRTLSRHGHGARVYWPLLWGLCSSWIPSGPRFWRGLFCGELNCDKGSPGLGEEEVPGSLPLNGCLTATSGENLFVVLFVMAPPSQELEPPINPGPFMEPAFGFHSNGGLDSTPPRGKVRLPGPGAAPRAFPFGRRFYDSWADLLWRSIFRGPLLIGWDEARSLSGSIPGTCPAFSRS
jgi:hypothetical protein